MNQYGSNPSPADLFHFLGMYISSALGLDAVAGTFIGAGLGVYLTALVVMQVLSLLLKDEDDISGIRARNRTRWKTTKYILRTVLSIYTVPIKLLFGAVAAPILFVANYLIPRRLVNAVGNLVTAERVDRVYELLFRFRPIRDDIDHLLVGGTINEEAYARKTWPEEDFEVLYIEDAEEDTWRGVIWDGRLPGGRHVPWLAWRHCTASKISTLWRGAIRVGFRAGIVFALITMALSVAMQAGHLAAFPYPAWTTSSAVIAKWWLSVGVHGVIASLGSAVVAALAGACFSIAVTYSAMNARLEAWWRDQSYALTLHTRDATVGYAANSPTRPNEVADYTEQAKLAVGRLKEEKQPLFPLGRSTGVVRRKGLWSAPIKGQLMCMDGESCRQHLLVMGASGTGKTYYGISPLIHRLLAGEWNGTFGCYIFDGKGGSLARKQYFAIKEAMQKRKLPKRDLYRIGPGTDMSAMDVCTPMSALKFRQAFEEASSQGGKEGDPKWRSFAGGCMGNAKEIGNVLQMDPDWECDPTWDRFTPASALGAYAIATDTEVTKKCLAKIDELRLMDGLPEDFQTQLVSANLKSAIEYFRNYWMTLNADTKSSIMANINLVYDKITGAGALRDRFYTGRYADTVPVGAGLDGAVVCVDIDSSYGIAGQITQVFISKALQYESAERFERDPASCRTKSCALIMDEYDKICGQDDPKSYWSICREYGIFGVLGVQSFAALRDIWGDSGVISAMVNISNILLLRINEESTINFFIELIGTTLRGNIISESMGYENQFEREEAVPDVAVPVNENSRFSMSDLLIREPGFGTPNLRQAAELDMRFVPMSGKEKISAEGAAHQRHQDQIEKRLAEGLEQKPILEKKDFQRGGGQAFFYGIRAGRVQFDIVDMRKVG